MIKSFGYFVLFVLFALMSPAQTLDFTGSPEEAGFSATRLKDLNQHMKSYVQDHKLPGMITVIARHGKVVSYETYGNMDEGKPMQADAIFRIASMTKPVTSVAVMMLYDEGLIGLNDPVEKYIPEFGNLRVYAGNDPKGMVLEKLRRSVTIRDLLLHTSGFTGGWGDTPVDSMYRSANLSQGTLRDMIVKLAEIPLLCQPGTRWNYSRSTDVLAYIVEVVSGKPFNVFLKERIFSPLKMMDTDYSVPNEKLERVCAVYTIDDSIGLIRISDPEINNVSGPVRFFSGNGALLSTANDYMIFSQMLLNKGEYKGVRLLKPQTVEMMTKNFLQNDLMPKDEFFGPLLSGMGYGLGFAVVDTGGIAAPASPGSYWWSGTANTYFFIDPQKELVILFMTQFVPNFYYPVCKEFREGVYQSMTN